MRISRLRYQPIEGGTLGGHFALHVKLGVGDDPEPFSFDLDVTTIAQRIHDAFEVLGLKHTMAKGVVFDAREAELLDAADMLSLLGTLRDWRFTIVAWVGEKRRSAWFELVNYLTVFVRSAHWPNFKVNEIRFVPSGDTWIEPEVYEVNNGAVQYVDASSGLPVTSVLTFVANAKRSWGIVPVTKAPFGIDFPLEGP